MKEPGLGWITAAQNLRGLGVTDGVHGLLLRSACKKRPQATAHFRGRWERRLLRRRRAVLVAAGIYTQPLGYAPLAHLMGESNLPVFFRSPLGGSSLGPGVDD